MEEEGVNAYLVPSTDPHQSEYIPNHWKRRRWISGFSGSAGEVLITTDHAGLWTDGRYFLQAEEQLDGTGIELHKMGIPDSISLDDWTFENLDKGMRLGVDPRLISIEGAKKLEKRLGEKGIGVKYIEENLVDRIWKDAPPPPDGALTVLGEELTGESVGSKLKRIREKMKEEGTDVHVLCALDTIAWTFNLRGSDVDYNPVFISYSVIGHDNAHLFVDTGKVTEEVRSALSELVEFHPYGEIEGHLRGIDGGEHRVWIDPKTTNNWIRLLLRNTPLKREQSPITRFKSVKNDVELEGFRKAHVQDGVAMVKFLRWLEEEVPNGGVTEISAADRLEGFRRESGDLVGLSFTTISGYGEHGAIVHYDVDKDSNATLREEGIYLVDSGGQYIFGTTDITRTVALGDPTDEQKEMFTRVLKGHIGLSTLRFPKGFSGKQIELAARRPIWEAGKNYNHGTGHGIGHYLNVHEGPMGITPRDPGVPISAGNVLSNEPGYYKAGEYGIRTENVIVAEKDEEFSTDELEWLRFREITLCPIDLNLVDPGILDGREKDWLNRYHRRVYEILSEHLDEKHSEWLRERTGPI